MSPTPRLAAGLFAAALLTALVSIPLGLVVAAALVGLALTDARTVARTPAVEWAVPGVLARGRAAEWKVRLDPISNPAAGSPGRVLVRQPHAAGLTFTPDRAQGGLDTRVTAHRRGVVEVRPPVVRVDGRLRLGRWTHTVGEPRRVKVVADLPGARRLAHEVRRGFRPGPGRSGARRFGLGTEFESVRDYLPDDDIRQVNWAATARVGRPMSNVYRLDQERDVICLLDAGRLMAAPVGDRTRLDAAVDAVCAVALVAEVVSDRCGLVVFDDAVRSRIPPRHRGSDALVDVASQASHRLVDSRYDLACQAVATHKRALVMVFTDLLDTAAARSLLEALPVLARRHAVVIAWSTDSDVDQLLATAPDTSVAAYRVAVAASVLDDAARATALLQRAGAQVVGTRPEDLPAASVDAYLRLKARLRF